MDYRKLDADDFFDLDTYYAGPKTFRTAEKSTTFTNGTVKSEGLNHNTSNNINNGYYTDDIIVKPLSRAQDSNMSGSKGEIENKIKTPRSGDENRDGHQGQMNGTALSNASAEGANGLRSRSSTLSEESLLGNQSLNEDGESLLLLGNREQQGPDSNDDSVVASTLAALALLWKAATRQGRLIIVTLFLVQLTDTMCISIMVPFFPKEAWEKGLKPQTIGWVFAVFPLIRFISSPLFGKLLENMGCRTMIVMAQALTGVSVVAFGLLDYIDSTENSLWVYTILCFVLRILTALGSAAGSTSVYVIVSVQFRDSYSQCYGILQAAIGLALIIGPALGGLLYAAGGYVVPFAVLGSAILFCVPLSLIALPAHEERGNRSSVDARTAWKLIKNAAVVIMGLAIINAAIIWSSLQPTLEPYLREFHLSPALMGLVYFMIGAMYIIFSPLVGWIADKWPISALLLMVVGFVLTCLSLLLLGPSPIFGHIADHNKLWLSLVSLAGLGMAASFAVVPCYNVILHAVGNKGFDITFAVSSFISGYYNSCWSLGEFVGPLLGSILADYLEFPLANTILAIVCLTSAVVIVVLYTFDQPMRERRRSLETPPAETSPDVTDEERTVH